MSFQEYKIFNIRGEFKFDGAIKKLGSARLETYLIKHKLNMNIHNEFLSHSSSAGKNITSYQIKLERASLKTS